MKTSDPRRGCGKCREIDCSGKCTRIELPRLRSKVKVTYPGGYDGKCPMHGGHCWSTNPEQAELVCARRDNGRTCGKNIEWTACPPAEFSGFVVFTLKTEAGQQLIYVHPYASHADISEASCFVLSNLLTLEVLASP